jgi:hypothetical protein
MNTSNRGFPWQVIAAVATVVDAFVTVVALLKGLTVLAALLGGLVPGLILAWVVAVYHRRELPRIYKALDPSGAWKYPQTNGRTLEVQEDSPDGVGRTFGVRCLAPPKDPGDLELNWITFLDGCERLSEWVQARVKPGLYVGVNTAGAIIANYLAGRRADDPTPILVYRTCPGKKDTDYPELGPLPPPQQVRDILVVDSEFKTGISIAKLDERLVKAGFAKARRWYVCLVACGIQFQELGANRTVPLQALFQGPVNQLVIKRDRLPHRFVYIYEGKIDAPRRIR